MDVAKKESCGQAADSSNQEYEHYREVERRLDEFIGIGFKSIDTWLLTLSGGAVVVSIQILGAVPDAGAAKYAVLVILAWLFLFVAILLAMSSKIYGYYQAGKLYSKIREEAGRGYAGLGERIEGSLHSRVQENTVLILNILCLISFFFGLGMILVFGSLNLMCASNSEVL